MKDFTCNLNFEAKIIAERQPMKSAVQSKDKQYNSCTKFQL